MTKTVDIEAIKPFNRTPQGEICAPGDRFAVSESRAEELGRLGLAKAAVAPENKMQPAPANKAARKPATEA